MTGTPAHLEHALTPCPGEVFTTGWPARAGDVDSTRRLRLDGIARYLQDVGIEDLQASEIRDSDPLWIVRRSVIDVHVDARMNENLTFKRWCAALSTRWTHMRVSADGDQGASIQTEGFWINVSEEKAAPSRISDRGLEALAATAYESRLKWKQWLTEPAPAPDGSDRHFPLRFADVDPFDHMNNAVYLAAVEEVLTDHRDLTAEPYRTIVEYNKPIRSDAHVVLRSRRVDRTVTIWFVVDDDTRTVVRVCPLSALDLH